MSDHLSLCQVDLSAKPLTRLALYRMLQNLLEEEHNAIEHVGNAQKEVNMANFNFSIYLIILQLVKDNEVGLSFLHTRFNVSRDKLKHK